MRIIENIYQKINIIKKYIIILLLHIFNNYAHNFNHYGKENNKLLINKLFNKCNQNLKNNGIVKRRIIKKINHKNKYYKLNNYQIKLFKKMDQIINKKKNKDKLYNQKNSY